MARASGLLVAALACGLGCEGAEPPPSAPAGVLEAPGLRRLSAQELERASARLLGKPLGLEASLPPDARHRDFSRNADAALDAISLRALYDAGERATNGLDVSALPVAPRLDELTRAAFGRAPTAQESQELQALFTAGSEGADFASGIALVLRALLGSTAFLYDSSLGSPAREQGAAALLSAEELARNLSWLIAGEPPDAALLEAAERGELNQRTGRRKQAARLLQHDGARQQYRRFVDEWLGLYRLEGLAKAPELEPRFAALAPELAAHTHALVDSSLLLDGGRVETLLRGNAGEPGLLQQRSFLAVYAHERDSAPVLRGQAVLERLLCRKLTKPAEIGLEVAQAPLDPSLTTRERFALHAAEPSCRACHDAIDGVGFTFESFDAVGRPRSEEAGKPVDTSGAIVLDGALLQLPDSVALANALAGSREVRDCAARQVVRFAVGKTAPELETAFLEQVQTLPPAAQGSVLELFVAFIERDERAWRKEAP